VALITIMSRDAGRGADPRLLDALQLIALALGDDRIEVRLLDLALLGDLELTAARFLTEPEQAEYAELRHPLRRREWLGARVCLKLMVLRQGLVGVPLDCAVIKDPRGRPRLVFAPGLATDVVADCSLSHKGRFVCAATSSAPGARIGVDIEEVSPRLRRLARQFAHARDRLLGSRLEDERLAILWALKEACSKVVGRGLAMAFREVACQEIAPGRHRVTTERLELTGCHTTHDGYVVALCVGASETRDR
jgi:phosphopantetheinyl transferase